MNDDQALDLLEQLVAIPSPSTQEHDAVEFLCSQMRSLGFDAHIDPAGNAVGTIGDTGPELCLLGHIDTIPGEVPVRREKGRLHGRGAVDAKGCLAAFVSSTARAHAAGHLKARVQVVGCVEEEATSSKGARYRATLDAPDAVIVGEPSHWDAVTLGYKGFLQTRCSFTESLAHTASDRTSAAAQACHAFVALEKEVADYNAKQSNLFDSLLIHLDDMSSESDGRIEHAHLDIKLRLPGELPPDLAEQWLRERIGTSWVRCGGGIEAWCGPRTATLPRLLARSIARTGGRARFQRKTGTADLNIVAPAWGCPALAYGPGDSALDHTPDEYISMEEYVKGVAVLTHFLGQENLGDIVQSHTPSAEEIAKEREAVPTSPLP